MSSSSLGMMTFPIGKIKDVPNDQADRIRCGCLLTYRILYRNEPKQCGFPSEKVLSHEYSVAPSWPIDSNLINWVENQSDYQDDGLAIAQNEDKGLGTFLSIDICGDFHKWGCPHIIYFNGIFSNKNHLFEGTPMTMETHI